MHSPLASRKSFDSTRWGVLGWKYSHQQAEGLVRPDVKLGVCRHAYVRHAQLPTGQLMARIAAHVVHVLDAACRGQAQAHVDGAQLSDGKMVGSKRERDQLVCSL